MTYVVTAPYVTLKVPDAVRGRLTLAGFHRGAVVPDGTDPEDVARHLRKGMIAELPAPAPEPVPAETPARPESKSRAKPEAS